MILSVSRPIRSRPIVTGLSAIICDFTRNPFLSVGLIVTRKSGASLQSEVIWQTTTDACSVAASIISRNHCAIIARRQVIALRRAMFT
jgi:hypothetical protein